MRNGFRGALLFFCSLSVRELLALEEAVWGGGDRVPSEMGDLLLFSSDAVKFVNQQTL